MKQRFELVLLLFVAGLITPAVTMAGEPEEGPKPYTELPPKNPQLKRTPDLLYIVCEYADGMVDFETSVPCTYVYMDVTVENNETGETICATITPANPTVNLQGRTGTFTITCVMDGNDTFEGEMQEIVLLHFVV